MSIRRRQFATFFLCLAALLVAVLHASAPSRAVQTKSIRGWLRAGFQHPVGQTLVTSQLDVAAPLTFEDNGRSATLRLGLSDGCMGFGSWAVEESVDPVGPVVVCLTSARASAGDVAKRAVAGKGKTEALELVWELQRMPSDERLPGQMYSLSQAVDGQLFSRGCGNALVPLGKLQFPAGSLTLLVVDDAAGQRQLSVTGQGVGVQLDSQAWTTLRDSCQGGDLLPDGVGDGASVSFGMGTQFNSSTAKTPWSATGGMATQVRIAEAAGELSSHDADRLVRSLVKTEDALSAQQVSKAEKEMAKLVQTLNRLSERGALDPNLASGLLKYTFRFDSLLERLQSPGPLDPPGFNTCDQETVECPSYRDCERTPYYVDAGADSEVADGTQSHPYADIASALARAESDGQCGADVFLAPGTYSEPLSIRAHTRLVGPTSGSRARISNSITNRGPYLLDVSNVDMVWSGEDVANGITVDHPCASTFVSHSSISGFRGYGIRQRSGQLLLSNTTVSRTRAYSTYLTQGTAVHLSCGASAFLWRVALTDNETSALQVTGDGTTATGFVLDVDQTGQHPAYEDPSFGGAAIYPGQGAVEVRDRAELDLSSYSVTNSTFLAVSAFSGGQARLRGGTIAHTRSSDDYFGRRSAHPGGLGVGSFRGGSIDLEHFAVEDSALCGVQVAAGVDLSLGEIRDTPIGACVQVDGYDVSRLTDRVSYVNCGQNFEARSYDVTVTSPRPPE